MFADRIKELREEKNISQKEFAKTIGVAQSTYALYETDKREPSFDVLIKIAQYFNVTTDYLLGLTNGRTQGNANINQITGLEETSINILRQYNHDSFGDDIEIRTVNTVIQDKDLLGFITCYLYSRLEKGIDVYTDKGDLESVNKINLAFFVDKKKDEDEQMKTVEWHIQDSISYIQLEKVIDCLKSIREKELIKYREFCNKYENLQAGDPNVNETE